MELRDDGGYFVRMSQWVREDLCLKMRKEKRILWVLEVKTKKGWRNFLEWWNVGRPGWFCRRRQQLNSAVHSCTHLFIVTFGHAFNFPHFNFLSYHASSLCTACKFWIHSHGQRTKQHATTLNATPIKYKNTSIGGSMQGTCLVYCWIFNFFFFWVKNQNLPPMFHYFLMMLKILSWTSHRFKWTKVLDSSKDKPAIRYKIEKKKYTNIVCAKGPLIIKL